MTTHQRQIDMIFGSLESAGFPRSLQNVLLSEWVTPEVLSDDSASSELAIILAKRLGLRASPLFAANPRVELLRQRDIKYKRSIPNKSKNLTAATSIAVSVAESIASACQVEFRSFVDSAQTLRQEVLASFPGQWLGLKNLLMSCWSHGIPVVYLSDIGKGVAKMDGTVVYTDSRPVIILSKTSPFWAWQLLILAHEIAHIALGHLAPYEILVDEEISEDSYLLKDNDPDEYAADRFAIELLNGKSNVIYPILGNLVNSAELAIAAYNYGNKYYIDPGHTILNFANHAEKWDVADAAAKVLQNNDSSAPMVINEIMWREIDSEALPLDTIEFIARVTGSSSREVACESADFD